jgi:hypothetical protein
MKLSVEDVITRVVITAIQYPSYAQIEEKWNSMRK